MSFLDMIPVSLSAAFPPAHIAERRAYATAVLAREDAIVDAQEAKDDDDDARENYAAHTETWERMLEYQRGMYAKREAERKRQREERKRAGGGEYQRGMYAKREAEWKRQREEMKRAGGGERGWDRCCRRWRCWRR